MPSDDIILVLTTQEKRWWWSLQEVIPALERVWTRIGQSERENVRMLCAPIAPEIEQRLQSSSPQLKLIVLIVATPETVKIALLLRLQMKVAAPLIVYVSGDSTEGFHAFGSLANALTDSDMFVVSSEAEAIATRCSFPNAQVLVIPFPLVDQFKVNGGERDTRLKAVRLAYVGRVSEQKNLHTLLLALWILRTSCHRTSELLLDIYGSEDGLGSPNMGLTYPNYGAYLQRLAELLGVGQMVTWHGFKPRDWLFDHVHQQPHILVSATLHSDENFGSSVLASLVNGHQVVTTAWGGHFGFQDWFSQQLILTPVHRSTMGPVVNPFSLANAILMAISRMSTLVVNDTRLDRARAEFSEPNVTTRTFELLGRQIGRRASLEKSPIQVRIDERRALFGSTRKIYADYADPDAQVFFEAYGMKERLTFHNQSSYLLVPWVSYSDNSLQVDDPHRGRKMLDVDAISCKLLDVALCPSMSTCRLPESLLKTLVTQGYAFLRPPVGAVERST